MDEEKIVDYLMKLKNLEDNGAPSVLNKADLDKLVELGYVEISNDVPLLTERARKVLG